MALGAADEQSAGRHHPLAALGHAPLDLGQQLAHTSLVVLVLGPDSLLRRIQTGELLGVAPSLMSPPRPAMFVAIVTAPGWPASATVSASRAACSGLAFSTLCVMPRLVKCSDTSSETSTE